jgi:hypothetical protein
VKASVAKALALSFSGLERHVGEPVLFIGCGRSGTNLLARLLDSHPDFAVYPREANELWHPGLYPWFRSSGVVPPIWKDAERFTLASLEARTAAHDRRLRALLASYRLIHRARLVVNKSVLITFMIPHVLEIFPDARFIHLVRDGRAAAHSAAKMEFRKISRNREAYRARGLEPTFEELLHDFASHWRQHIAAVETQRHALRLDAEARLLELHYEALCADPRRALVEIARFLDVDAGGFRLDGPRRAAIQDQNYKFREELDEATIERITSLTEPELSLKGYAG